MNEASKIFKSLLPDECMLIEDGIRPVLVIKKINENDDYEYLGYADKHTRSWFKPSGVMFFDYYDNNIFNAIYTAHDFIELYLTYSDLIDE
jgi:hypothetical protein